MIYALPFPMIDPVLVHLGPVAIHWYGVAYVLSILGGWQYCSLLAKRSPQVGITPQIIDDALMWLLGGIIIGGRLGHVILYDPLYFAANPLDVFMLWKGGMSFHGGLMGVGIALLIYTRKNKIPFFALSDVFSTAAPIGFFLGRLANFINSECYGRVTDVYWSFVFPTAGPLPRHPSQLYEAFLEGIVLFFVILFFWTKTDAKEKQGRITGIFLFGYGISRIIAECYREPETLGLILGNITWGQILCLPMIGFGWFLIRFATYKKGETNA